MGCLFHQSPRFYNYDFLFVGLTSLVHLVNFDWLIHYDVCSNGLTTNFNLQNFVYRHLGCTLIYQPLLICLSVILSHVVVACFSLSQHTYSPVFLYSCIKVYCSFHLKYSQLVVDASILKIIDLVESKYFTRFFKNISIYVHSH